MTILRTAPGGQTVYWATHSTKRREVSGRGGTSRRAATSFVFAAATRPSPAPQTTPRTWRLARGTVTKSPVARVRSAGTRVIVGPAEGQWQHYPDPLAGDEGGALGFGRQARHGL